MQKVFYFFSSLFFCFTVISNGQNLEQKIDSYIQNYVEANNFSGTVLVARGGEILYKKAHGLADRANDVPCQTNTVYQIASVSKPFTAAAILWLAEHGKLSVDDPLSKYIPDFRDGDKITLHHALTHTSGIPNINAFASYDTISRFPQTPASLIENFKHLPLDFEPGETYSYSNSNYNVLAYIIEQVSGQSYGDFLKEKFFDPLGMQDTRHRQAVNRIVPRLATGYAPMGAKGLEQATYLDWSAKTGNGSLYSTVEDLYKWDRALYPDKILSAEGRELMFTARVPNVGYGWFLSPRYNKTRHYINGRSPGYTAYFLRYPDDDVCIIALGNNYIPLATQIGNDIAAMLFEEDYSLPPKPMDFSVPTLEKFTGTYQFNANFFRPNDVLEFEIQDGELMSTWGPFVPLGDNRFLIRYYWMEGAFEMDSNGKPVLVIAGSKAPRVRD